MTKPRQVCTKFFSENTGKTVFCNYALLFIQGWSIIAEMTVRLDLLPSSSHPGGNNELVSCGNHQAQTCAGCPQVIEFSFGDHL